MFSGPCVSMSLSDLSLTLDALNEGQTFVVAKWLQLEY